MIFSSHLFLFYFLPLALLLNYTLPFRYLSLMLTIVSYVFYGWANPPWVLLMLISSYVDYFCGLGLVRWSGLPAPRGAELPILDRDTPRNTTQKTLLATSIISNLTILALFKYYDFGASSIAALAKTVGIDLPLPMLHILLPAGVSFYTFQSMSYAIDVYRGDARALRNPIDFQCFVANFPHLIAGPIVRYQTMDQQLRARTFTYEKFARGVTFFAIGMSKKILLANPMGYVADHVFAAPAVHCVDAWYGVISYAFQIYFDFSGYSDMAVGLGLMFGFLFVRNFDAPYSSASVTEFWRRWHISLSTWLRDYLYVPLGGNRLGRRRTYVNLMTVMLFGGLWHGASWNFVVWGGMHGTALAVERAMRGRSGRVPRFAAVALTFGFTSVAWVFFRAETLPAALRMIASLFGAGTASSTFLRTIVITPYHAMMFVICAIVVWLAPETWTFTQTLTPRRAFTVLAMFAISVAVMWTQIENPFLYFRF